MSAPATRTAAPRVPDTVSAAAADTRTWSAPHLVGFLVLWALTQVAAALVWYPDTLSGGQVDTDGYMRLVRVRELLAGGSWYDPIIARSNWPYGEVMHWTRPLDALILTVVLVLRPFMSSADALAAAGAVISALCHVGVCIAAVWAVHPIVRGAERFFAMPAVLAQTSVMAYGGLGRADHHMLIFLFFTLALGAWIRVLLAPEDRRAAFMAGAFSGAGLWVGPETLLPLAVLFLSGATAWILRGDRYTASNVRLSLGLAAAIAAALIMERSPATWLAAEFDRISMAHLHVALLALAFWLIVSRTRATSARVRGRVAGATAGALVAVAILLLVHPRFFRGPWVDVDPAVIGVWLSRVTELQPAFPRAAEDVGRFVSMLGAAILLTPFLVVWAWRERQPERRLVWLLLLTSLIVYVPLAAAQQRFSPYAGIVAAIAGIELLRRAFRRLAGLSGGRLSVARVTLILGVLLWPIIAGESLNAAIPNGTAAKEPVPPSCDLTDAAVRLNDPGLTGPQPRTIVAFIDFGPELLYRTSHRVLAGPYHRNRAGILAAHTLLTTSDEREALDIARRRGVDLILLCPSRGAQYFGGIAAPSVYGRLVRGERPPWIQPLPFASPGFLLFAVDPARVGS